MQREESAMSHPLKCFCIMLSPFNRKIQSHGCNQLCAGDQGARASGE